MDDQRPEKSSSATFVSLAVIDIADNIPDFGVSNSAANRTKKATRSGSSNTPLPSTHYRGKKKGGGSIGGHKIGGSTNEARRQVSVGNNSNKMGAGLRIRCL